MKIYVISMKDEEHPHWANEIIQKGFKTVEDAKEEIKRQEEIDKEKGWDYSYFIQPIYIED